MAEIGTDITKAKALLESGALVAIPTETVYGLAGNALDPDAVTQIFAVKERPQFDPLIVHVPDFSHVPRYAIEVPPGARLLAEHFWPGPLTLLLKKKDIVPDIVTAGLDTVGLRSPDHALPRQLLSSLPFPLAAPSANPFGYVSPTRPDHVNDQLGNKIPYILDGGPCDIGIESTIVGFEKNVPIVYRMGGLSVEAIERIVGKIILQAYSSSNPKAPGQLKSHYAPSRRVVIGKIEELLRRYPAKTCGLLTFQRNYRFPYQYVLSPSGTLEEAAQNLFTALREFDKMPIDIILSEPMPDQGLGRAINDRLRRAAAAENP